MIRDRLRWLGRASARALWALCGVCIGATACWIVWGVATPGDYFGNGVALIGLSLFAFVAAGGYAGFKARSKRARIALVLLSLACALFWFGAPNGWWVKPPPAAAGPP
jgi:hypothetical protein